MDELHAPDACASAWVSCVSWASIVAFCVRVALCKRCRAAWDPALAWRLVRHFAGALVATVGVAFALIGHMPVARFQSGVNFERQLLEARPGT
jgi:hypothetical protein